MKAGLVPLALAAAALAQEPASFHSSVELVTIPCSVVDAHGEAVRNLTREDFRVFDNGTPRIIDHFWADDDQPLTLGMLIDESESQGGRRAEHRQTALHLIARLVRPGDRAFVISVNEQVKVWRDLAGASAEPFGEPCPRQPLRGPGLGSVSMCGESPLWNAVYDAARLKLLTANGSKALLLLTDGFDSGSTRTWMQAADAVRTAGAMLYAVQYPSESGRSYAPTLYRLITETGGAWFPPPAKQYEAIVSRMETDLRHRYVLGFRPEELSGRMRHDVRVEVTRPDLTVRARTVYFRDRR